MLAGGLWAGPVHKASLVPCGKPLVARLKAPTVSHPRGLPKAWVSHKGGTEEHPAFGSGVSRRDGHFLNSQPNMCVDWSPHVEATFCS